MARKTSPLEDMIVLASKLPWWLCAVLAVVLGIYLHSVASAPIPTSFDPQRVHTFLTASFFRGFATVGQYLVPFIFFGGAVASIFGRRKRRNLLSSAANAKGNPLLGIGWHDFELLVGEALRRRGYAVQETGAKGPDGGVDLIARKEGETYLVQCKQWRAVHVGVPVVRELYGAMAAEGAVGGFLITSGKFTQPAREFASGRNLQLIDGAALKQWIAEAKKDAPQPKAERVRERVEPEVVEPEIVAPLVVPPAVKPPAPKPPVTPKAPACPFCRKTMVMRVARTGANAGGNFWGCADYPKCRGIRPIFAPMKL